MWCSFLQKFCDAMVRVVERGFRAGVCTKHPTALEEGLHCWERKQNMMLLGHSRKEA